jgi:hypothetical protein
MSVLFWQRTECSLMSSGCSMWLALCVGFKGPKKYLPNFTLSLHAARSVRTWT